MPIRFPVVPSARGTIEPIPRRRRRCCPKGQIERLNPSESFPTTARRLAAPTVKKLGTVQRAPGPGWPACQARSPRYNPPPPALIHLPHQLLRRRLHPVDATASSPKAMGRQAFGGRPYVSQMSARTTRAGLVTAIAPRGRPGHWRRAGASSGFVASCACIVLT